MTTLVEYLKHKRRALLARREWIHRHPDFSSIKISASAVAAGRSGIRRISVRDFQIISDSPVNFAGYDLGPTSPELFLGSLSSCLTHTFLIHAADLEIALNGVNVDVWANIDPRAGTPGYEHAMIYPHDIGFVATITTEVTQLDELIDRVERFCPILTLLRRGNEVKGKFIRRAPENSMASSTTS